MDTPELPTTLESLWSTWWHTAAIGGLGALVVAYIILALRNGLLVAGDRMYSSLVSAGKDIVFLSPRRTAAIAWLAMKESLKRQIAAGIGIFFTLLAFAVWFLDNDGVDASPLYISFILSACNYLILALAVISTAFSLPNDLKNKTIYTVVTKPVRASEIVLGRMLGFTVVCTLPLVLFGVCGYVFIIRSLSHTHELHESDLTTLPSDEVAARRLQPGAKEGLTSTAQNHRHKVVVDAAGNGFTEANDSSRFTRDEQSGFLERFGQSHRHSVTAVERDGRKVYQVGPPEDQLHARVPIRGAMHFIAPDGTVNNAGINVGNWTNRGYVPGGTLAAAVFRFSDVTAEDFPEGMRVMLNIRLFRTTKEGFDQPLLGSLVVRNPYTRQAAIPRNFAAREYFTIEQFIPRALTDAGGNKLDLFKDLVSNGELEIELQCVPRSQYFGVGVDDVYLLARENSFGWNFAKGVFGIWLQMVVAVALGVVWSTFLTGPVAMLAAGATVIGAVLKPDLLKVVQGKLFGTAVESAGMFESMIRIGNQTAAMQQLEKGLTTDAVKGADQVLNWTLEGVFRFVPDFSAMNDAEKIATGFDVSAIELSLHLWQAVGFIAPLFLVGLLIFKSIEIAKA